jgi:hypothetical protein
LELDGRRRWSCASIPLLPWDGARARRRVGRVCSKERISEMCSLTEEGSEVVAVKHDGMHGRQRKRKRASVYSSYAMRCAHRPLHHPAPSGVGVGHVPRRPTRWAGPHAPGRCGRGSRWRRPAGPAIAERACRRHVIEAAGTRHDRVKSPPPSPRGAHRHWPPPVAIQHMLMISSARPSPCRVR